MKLNYEKLNGLIPAIIQDADTGKVLMLGFMNEAAYQKTIESKRVTFYSRSRKTLWTKGETSGNFLHVKEISADCDADTLLIKATPDGPVCHTGKDTCFDEVNRKGKLFLRQLELIIQDRRENPPAGSYTAKLFEKGMDKIAQKLGEEAVETVIEAMKGDRDRLKEESADLLYHLMVLLTASDLSLRDVDEVLRQRHGE